MANQVREELIELINSGIISQAQIAGECGLSTATISMWLQSKYSGDNAKVENTIKRVLDRRKKDDNLIAKRLPFTQTSVTKAICEVAEVCQMNGLIGLVTGESGIGKTRSIEWYCSNGTGVIHIRAHAKYSTKDVFADIHRALGFDGTGNVHKMMNDIVSKISGNKRLIIIDEAEHLTANTLDEIRQINDRSGAGVLYVGLPKFRAQLKTLRSKFEYIVNRISVPRRIDQLSTDDVEALVRTVLPEAAGKVSAEFHSASAGNARVLETLIFNVQRTLRIRQKTERDAVITPDMIRQVAIHVIV